MKRWGDRKKMWSGRGCGRDRMEERKKGKWNE